MSENKQNPVIAGMALRNRVIPGFLQELPAQKTLVVRVHGYTKATHGQRGLFNG